MGGCSSIVGRLGRVLTADLFFFERCRPIQESGYAFQARGKAVRGPNGSV